MQTIRALKKDLKVPLIGFAGAPFTLASYLVEGGKSANYAKTKKMMFGAPDDFKALMEKLAEVVRRYLRAQVDGGGRRRAALRLVGGRARAGRLRRAHPAPRRATSCKTS